MRLQFVALTAAALLVGGCGLTPQGDFVRERITTRGAEAYDEGLNTAEWFLCYAASIGAIKRKYGVSETKANAYKTLCGAGEDADVIGAPESQPSTVIIQ